METQHHIKAQNFLMLGLQLIFLLAGIGACVDISSIAGKVDRFNPSSVYKSNPNISSLSSEKYLMKSYFEKYGTLFDSDFLDFIAHGCSLGSCKALPDDLNPVFRLSILQHHLIGDGSHRHLFTSFKFNTQLKDISKLPNHVCEAIIIERLPSGVFADPFELQHLVQRGVFSDAAVFGDTNLELPSALSNQSAVEIHMDLDPNILLKNDKALEVKIEVPLHARYPRLESNGYSTVEIGAPDLFVRCSIEGTAVQHRNCVWMLTDQGAAESVTAAVFWRIPCGIETHAKSDLSTFHLFSQEFLSRFAMSMSQTVLKSNHRHGKHWFLQALSTINRCILENGCLNQTVSRMRSD